MAKSKQLERRKALVSAGDLAHTNPAAQVAAGALPEHA
jgi:hypothetical protein